MKKSILFVTEKYCERGDFSDRNLTNTFHNIFKPCEDSQLFTQDHLWLDEIISQGSHIDIVLPQQLFTNTYDYLIFSYYGCDYTINPSIATIQNIKYYFPDTKLIFLWWDASHPCIQQQIKDLDQYTDLHINFDSTDLTNITNKSYSAGVSQDETLYYPDEQIYNVSFVGRTDGYIERQQFLKFLIDNNCNINIAGGRTQQKLSKEEYARIIRQSKININFCNTAHGWPQCKGRCYEITASKSLLLEQKNSITSNQFKEGIDYYSFDCKEQLLSSIKYFLIREDERAKFAKNGYNTYLDKYKSSILWNKIYEL